MHGAVLPVLTYIAAVHTSPRYRYRIVMSDPTFQRISRLAISLSASSLKLIKF